MATPYIPNTPADQRAMLDAIGIASIDDLFADIPAAHRNPPLALPPALTEQELQRQFAALAARNASAGDHACYLGGGAAHHFIPSSVWRLAMRSEFLTSYTPYQPEISQGVLQALYEFQSALCQLTGMEAANTGMYDGATALAEAALMACRVTGRRAVHALPSVSTRCLDVVRTYAMPQGIEVRTGETATLGQDAACLLVQSPNAFGYLEDVAGCTAAAHAAGALAVVCVNPISLGMFAPPEESGVDIVVGEGQPLGIPLSFGGPYLGLFACKEAYLRQMPGRIVGRTVDGAGKTGYVLTLQTREQHIRRERATSNICTSESLVAIAATIYLAAMGRHGLRHAAELCYHKAHYAAQQIAAIPGYRLPQAGVFFNEFLVECPRPPAQINRFLRRRKIIGGQDVSDRHPNGMVLCVTEQHSREQLDALADALRQAAAEHPRKRLREDARGGQNG